MSVHLDDVLREASLLIIFYTPSSGALDEDHFKYRTLDQVVSNLEQQILTDRSLFQVTIQWSQRDQTTLQAKEFHSHLVQFDGEPFAICI